ncbi:hypothetical protein EVG20_g28 [Dentipellis fragilis]|uniref:Ribosomal protein L22 n=1 Tax=Dentipellis fragilis TaxID=205917 RepID=A0A4Y9ZHJ3_9AGAM|nr:hypothetical protein EVG20_g28 [Dentipellis fragilis]
MQGLRSVTPLRRVLQPHQIASSSCTRFWDGRRHASLNPIDWFRQQINSAPRQKKSEKEIDAAKQKQAEQGNLGVFDAVAPEGEAAPKDNSMIVKNKSDHHKYSTANFKISHRKLNKLGRQISGKPIDSAILQMTFSEKRASNRLKSMLVVAKSHAILKGIDASKMIVSESWVTKGPRQQKRLEIKGRARHGIRIHPDSRMSVVLKEGKTRQELLDKERARKLGRIRSSGLVREDKPLRNPPSQWAW